MEYSPNLEQRKLILEAESCLSRIFAPPKITHYTVGSIPNACGRGCGHIMCTAFTTVALNFLDLVRVSMQTGGFYVKF